jgi:1-acyl-sn-glycerol-3-phosphate acyltransferase
MECGGTSLIAAPAVDIDLPRRPLPVLSTGPVQPRWAAWRLVRILATIVRYQRLAARSETLNGGQLPRGELQAFLTGWAREVMPLLGMTVQRIGTIPPLETPAIFVGNHLSYLDVPVLMSQVPVVLLAKEEIARWPLFGAAGRRAGMVFVKRESDGSRRQAAAAITECLRGRRMSLGLFPSGTTTLDEGRPWRSGAFRIAQMGQVPVQPFRLAYDPITPVAFLGNDYLLPHLFRLLSAGAITARIEFGAPRLVADPEAAAQECWEWSRQTARGTESLVQQPGRPVGFSGLSLGRSNAGQD